MKTLKTSLVMILFLLSNSKVKANHEEIICPQPYGNGVVCGAKTHEPVDTALGDNPVEFAGILLVSSFVLTKLSKKLRLSRN